MVNITRFVRCVNTGDWYDPWFEFMKNLGKSEILAVFIRMKNK